MSVKITRREANQQVKIIYLPLHVRLLRNKYAKNQDQTVRSNNRELILNLWKTPPPHKRQKSPKKLLHFRQNYNILKSVEVKTKPQTKKHIKKV